MMRVLLCVGQQHDLYLVALALLVCMIGSASTVQLYGRIGTASGGSRIGWAILTSVATGTMVWCTHFVAMLAYRSDVPVTLDPVLTLVSLGVAVFFTVPGMLLAGSSRARWASLAGGGIVGGAIAAMHYLGMRAYHIDGFVRWDMAYVVASILLSIGLAALAFDMMRLKGGLGRRLLGATTIGAAVAALHFTGMAAITVTPLAQTGVDGLSEITMQAVAIATSLGGLLVIGCAAISALIDDQTRSANFRRMRHLALHDSLTDLPNRGYFHQLIAADLTALSQRSGKLGVVVLDLSSFKAINDKYGHQAGDQLLTALATRLQNALAPGETVARLGGDEFAALKPHAAHSDFEGFVARIRAEIDKPFQFERFATHCRANIGIAIAPDHGRDPDLLLALADRAMYQAKSQKSLEPSWYEAGMDQAAQQRRSLAEDLRGAIGTSAIRLAYQVQVATRDGAISGYEALARWTHPQHGMVSPGEFIPLAEEIGEINRLGNQVLRQACLDAASWSAPYPVAVNLSPIQLNDPELVDKVRDALAISKLPPHRLELELTESAFLNERHHALSRLRQIKRLGVKIALDDFGSGYSSIDVLRSFPFDRLKLDASFVAEIEHDAGAIAILRTIADLGIKLGIPVLAEGIENAAQLEIVRSAGCANVQGFLLGRPSFVLAAPALAPLRQLIRAARNIPLAA